MTKYLFLLLVLAAGCLPDPIEGPQVVPQPVFPPGAIYYRSITGTQDLEIRWNPPLAAIQENFKGYFLRLYLSDTSGALSGTVDTGLLALIDSVHVPKSDTIFTFFGKVVQGGRYTIRIWGEKFT